MPKVKVGNIEIYYETHGEGAPLLMINGYSADSEDWDLLVPRASQLSNHQKVIIFDNRGTGRSSIPEGEYSIKIMADDAARLLDALQIPRTDVLGVSMGGMIAQELAINYPKKVHGLVLACTFLGGARSMVILGQREALEKLRWMFTPPPDMSPEAVTEELLNLSYHKKYLEENKDRIISSTARYPTPLSTLEKQFEAILRHDAYDRLRNIQSKTLVLHGEDDILIMPENALMLAGQIPNAKLKMFKEAGHSFLEEKWKEAYPIIKNFLKEIEAEA